MENLRKIFILKQVDDGFSNCIGKVSGILRIEEKAETYIIYLTIINIISINSGEYSLYINDGNSEREFFLDKKPNSINLEIEKKIFNFNNRLNIGLFYVKDNLPILVAKISGENYDINSQELKKLYENYLIIENRKQEMYNDKAVATENYYENKEKENESIYNEFSIKNIESEKETPKNGNEFDAVFNEENFDNGKPYYESARKELDNLFSKFPSFDDLKRFFPDSKWVKINYSNDKFYVVGVVKENNKEKYICYGVPEKYSANPPKELEGYAIFIPLSMFNLEGDGYWMMFQDAVTENCVKK